MLILLKLCQNISYAKLAHLLSYLKHFCRW